MSVTTNLSDSMGVSSKDDIQMVCGNEQPLIMLVNYLIHVA